MSNILTVYIADIFPQTTAFVSSYIVPEAELKYAQTWK